MLGVVLWHDQKSDRALIWCEDQGDLAYFNGNDSSLAPEEATLGTGDLVRFDVKERANGRYVSNPTPVARSAFSSLSDMLRQALNLPENRGVTPVEGASRALAGGSGTRMAEIVPFPVPSLAMAASK